MSVCWTQQCFCIKMQNLIVDPEFFIENMDVLPSIPVCRFVCKNGKENTALMMKLANYFEIYKLLAFRVEKSYFASIIRVTRLWSTRHSLIINTWVWVTRFRQFTIIEPTPQLLNFTFIGRKRGFQDSVAKAN